MACNASQARLRRGRMQVLSDRFIHHAIQQNGEVMTAAAPFRRLNAVDLLHVHYRLAVPLIVEGGEVMRRLVPLFVDIGMTVALGAGVRCQKKICGDEAAGVGFDGTGEKMTAAASALFVHAGWRGRRIPDEIIGVWAVMPHDSRGEGKEDTDKEDGARCFRRFLLGYCGIRPPSQYDKMGDKQKHAKRRCGDMQDEQPSIRPRRPDYHQVSAGGNPNRQTWQASPCQRWTYP